MLRLEGSTVEREEERHRTTGPGRERDVTDYLSVLFLAQ